MRQWIIAAVACAGLAGGGWYYFQDDGCDEKEAYRAFQVAMAQHLRAPSNAIYQPFDLVSAPNGECSFIVAGYVESQNPLGAMVKTTFSGKAMKSVIGDYVATVNTVNSAFP